MATGKSSPKQKNPWHYEETVEKIEVIIDQIETGSLDLEEVFDRFTEATTYLKECDHWLATSPRVSINSSIFSQRTSRKNRAID